MESTASVSASDFTNALSLAANGVSIVTTDGSAGKAGLTVSSMCSVCAEPALVLACVNAANEFCKIADANGAFAINLLTTEQINVSNTFAGFGDDADRFTTGTWHKRVTGAPVLQDALVSMDCVFVSATTHGTHRIYIGRVVDVRGCDAEALVYTQRSYAHTSPLNL